MGGFGVLLIEFPPLFPAANMRTLRGNGNPASVWCNGCRKEALGSDQGRGEKGQAPAVSKKSLKPAKTRTSTGCPTATSTLRVYRFATTAIPLASAQFGPERCPYRTGKSSLRTDEGLPAHPQKSAQLCFGERIREPTRMLEAMLHKAFKDSEQVTWTRDIKNRV
ncbi:hypothetical protein HB777_39760 (plasmid) [Mesorhizobium loti]|nr:hypothetical protein HB777_39760 [Mesorhizobium loti]